jgi:hypothetical protein
MQRHMGGACTLLEPIILFFVYGGALKRCDVYFLLVAAPNSRLLNDEEQLKRRIWHHNPLQQRR